MFVFAALVAKVANSFSGLADVVIDTEPRYSLFDAAQHIVIQKFADTKRRMSLRKSEMNIDIDDDVEMTVDDFVEEDEDGEDDEGGSKEEEEEEEEVSHGGGGEEQQEQEHKPKAAPPAETTVKEKLAVVNCRPLLCQYSHRAMADTILNKIPHRTLKIKHSRLHTIHPGQRHSVKA
jgi:hypothetical protein